MCEDKGKVVKKVLIIGSSKLPIPAVKGGAVPNLIENIVRSNEEKHKVDFTCLSCFDSDAVEKSKKYKYTNFEWIKTPNMIKKIDSITSYIFKKVFKISRLLSLSYFFHIIWFTLKVAKHLKNNQYDKIIFENSIPVLHSLRLYRNSKKYEGKYYFHIHTVPRKYYFNKSLLEKSNSIICISEYVKNEIKKATQISENKFSILYNSVDTNLFKPLNNETIIETKNKYSIPSNKKIILFAGRICKDKGIDHVIKAQRYLDNDYILLVAGSNFYKTSIKSDFENKLIEENKDILDKIKFSGYIDYSDMPELYNCSDIVVLPSMWEEPAGMTIIEAMACKKPVITTISGGIPEYTEKENCILLERNENISFDIAENIKRVFNDSDFRNTLSNNAYNRAVIFNLNYYYETFINIIGAE